MSEKSSISPPSGDDAAPSRAHVFAGPYIRPRSGGGRRVIAPPHEQAGQVQAVVGMQMREQHMHRVGVGMALQRAEHSAAEVDDQRRRVGRGQQIAGRWRIRPDNTAGATEYGDSHAH